MVLYYTFVNGGMMSETQNQAIFKEGTRDIHNYYKSLFEDVMKEAFFRRLNTPDRQTIKPQQNMPQIISMEECEQIGFHIEEMIFKNVVNKLNESHQPTTELPYFDQLSIDIAQADDINQDSPHEFHSEIPSLMREEYRTLDELKQHCLFLYLFTNDKEEDEIVESMSWHFEEAMIKRAQTLINQC